MINRLLPALGCIFFLLSGCRESKPVFSNFDGFTQGTTYSIIYDNKKSIEPEAMREKVEKILNEFDMSLSLYKDSSLISRINRNEYVRVDTYFGEAYEKSRLVFEMTSGAFDITVGPLVRAWGFGPDAQKSFRESKRDSLMQLVGMNKVELRNNKIVKAVPGISLDFNAIAQGYSVDVICRYFDEKGIKGYLVEIGGEVRVRGDKGGAMWKIGIDRPEDNNIIPGSELQAVIKLKDRSLATSGNYRKFFVENGIKYSHTIDPRTGYPAKNQLLSATILASDCATADGIATACMVMGKDKSIEFLGLHPEFEAFLVYSDDTGEFKTWTSEKLKDYIEESSE